MSSLVGGGGGDGLNVESGYSGDAGDGSEAGSPSLALVSLESDFLSDEEPSDDGENPPLLDEEDPSDQNEVIVDETTTPPLSHMPEPGSLLLFGSGLLASAFRSKIRKKLFIKRT